MIVNDLVRRSARNVLFRIGVTLAAALVATYELHAASETFRKDCEALARAPHRLSGTAESHEAISYIATRLEGMGLDQVIVQPFRTAQTRVKRCEVRIGGDNGQLLQLHPIRPNGIINPVSRPEGITGPIFKAGTGDIGCYGDKSPLGAIVVLDYNCRDGWLRAFRLGAKAVVFVKNGPAEAWHNHYVEADTNLPRFFYDGNPDDLQDGAQATIHSEVVWDTVEGRNVIGYIKGTEPTFHLEKEEVMVIAANTDTFGEVPTLSPGARGAANCAALLNVAEHLVQNKPRRNILVVFFDNQARGHAGSCAFYNAIEHDHDQMVLEERLKSIEYESSFLDLLEKDIASETPLATKSDARSQMFYRLKEKAAEHAYDVNGELVKLRESKYELEEDTPGYDEALAAIESKVSEREAIKDEWNALRRILAKMEGQPTPGSPEARRLAIVLNDAQVDITVRKKELKEEGAAVDASKLIDDLIGEMWIGLHTTLILDDLLPQWGLVIDGDSDWHSDKDKPGLYGKIQSTFLSAHEACTAAEKPVSHFETHSADGTLTPARLLWTAPYMVHSGEIAGRHGIFNIVLGTVQERLEKEGTPDDVLTDLDLDIIEGQAVEAGHMLAAVASEEGLSLRRSIEVNKEYVVTYCKEDGRVIGPRLMAKSEGSAVPNKPMPDATIRICVSSRRDYMPLNLRKVYGFDNFQVLRSDRNGTYSYGPTPADPWHNRINTFAAAFDDRGQAEYASNLSTEFQSHTRINMFICRQGAIVLPPLFEFGPAKVMNAIANAPLEQEKSYVKTLDGLIYWFCEEKIDAIKVFGLRSTVALINGPATVISGAPIDDPEGQGISIGGRWEFPPSSKRAASDLWRLDESRMEILRSRGVNNSSVEELHGRAEDLIIDAEATQAVAKREALAASSFLAQMRVYDRTRGALDDLVRAVLVLLALSVPFAFALERLLIGATTIYRRIIGFVSFFFTTFLILYLSHPAFAIAATPIIIFLGFAIVTLSCLVIAVIMSKFEVELKVLQGMKSTVHAADVSRLSTVIAAMNMGISTMRRRPLRTALTAVTIILLTFTILCFASFGTRVGIIKYFVAPAPNYAGLFVHDVNWNALGESILQIIKGRWGDDGEICRRYWLSPQSETDKGVLVTCEDGNRPLSLRGVLGLDPSEFRHRPDLVNVLDTSNEGLEGKVWLTSAVAEKLEISTGDEVVVSGIRLKVAPFLQATKVAIATDMDDSSILPVDFSAMTSGQGGQDMAMQEATAAMEDQNWAYLPVDSVVIVSADTAARMGATLRAISIYTSDTDAAVEVAEDFARMASLPVAATRADGVFRHVLGNVMSASGVRDLLFPLLLGGLVIFGTMLGSVADREREIYTFSALGLAPPHVASLFFAEALVYSVIGGLGGYLLAQGTMKVLEFLASFGIVRVPEINYSSMNAIVTILVVMITVLISSLYPAIKASRSANPGLMRSWQVPAPEGDVLSLTFPFTVSSWDITGVVSFLKEHFDNYSDSGMGSFMARDTELVQAAAGDADVGLGAHLALAPFDLGVTQIFHLHSTPSEIAGIDEVKISLSRLSGQPKDWRRLNKVLLDDLRKQFLIWRSLPHETMEMYRDRTLQHFGMPQDDDDKTKE